MVVHGVGPRGYPHKPGHFYFQVLTGATHLRRLDRGNSGILVMSRIESVPSYVGSRLYLRSGCPCLLNQ
jgi:hypothetical protein